MRKLSKIFILLFIGLIAYGIISFLTRITLGEKRNNYSQMKFDSLYITKTTSNTQKGIMVYDKDVIEGFLGSVNECMGISREKFNVKTIYSFNFYGATKISLDVSVIDDGRIILDDLNSIFVRTNCFNGFPLKEFLLYADTLKMK